MKVPRGAQVETAAARGNTDAHDGGQDVRQVGARAVGVFLWPSVSDRPVEVARGLENVGTMGRDYELTNGGIVVVHARASHIHVLG